MSVNGEYSYKCTLTPELIKKAEKELNEKENWRDRDVQALREMINDNKGLKCPLNSGFLLRFLRAGKFDYERSYQLLINYYTIRAENADILKELTPTAIEYVLDSNAACFLPRKDKINRKIMYLRPGRWSPDKFPMIELLRANLLSLEEAIKDEETQVNGFVAIGNLTDVGIAHVRYLDRNYIRNSVHLIQEAFPLRFKGLHFINEPSVFGYLYSVLKPFLKKKMIERLHFHGSSLESLQNFFDKSCLPQELGGELPAGDEIAKAWKKTLIDDEDMFKEMQNYGIELAKNIFGRKTLSEHATDCIIGSYKKIDN